jgi:hypothetical protein
MARKIISRDQLKAWMTAEIQKFEGCEEVEVNGITPLREPDSEGVNWSDTIGMRVTGVPKEIYKAALAKVLATARARFNIRMD